MAKNDKSGKTTKSVRPAEDTSRRIEWNFDSRYVEWETEKELFEEYGDLIPHSVMVDIKRTYRRERRVH